MQTALKPMHFALSLLQYCWNSLLWIIKLTYAKAFFVQPREEIFEILSKTGWNQAFQEDLQAAQEPRREMSPSMFKESIARSCPIHCQRCFTRSLTSRTTSQEQHSRHPRTTSQCACFFQTRGHEIWDQLSKKNNRTWCIYLDDLCLTFGNVGTFYSSLCLFKDLWQPQCACAIEPASNTL